MCITVNFVSLGREAQDNDVEVTWDITTFRGFCILTTAAEIVKASIEIDKICKCKCLIIFFNQLFL